MKRLLALLLLLSFATGATLSLELKDFSTSNAIPDANVFLEVLNVDSGETEEYIKPVANGVTVLSLSNGAYEITVKIDDLRTFGKDYFGVTKINLASDSQAVVFLEPVGSLRGEVVDESGVPQPGAVIKLTCSGSYGMLDDLTTNEAGAFNADWLPIGSCRLSILSNALHGSDDVIIRQGEITNTAVTAVASDSNPLALLVTIHPLWFVALAFVIIIIETGIIFHLYRMKAHAQLTVAHHKAERASPNIIIHQKGRERKVDQPDVVDTVMKTLTDRERRIVEAIREQGGETTQAKIYSLTRIPKTSLVRAIQTLEKRKIIETTKFGKMVKIKIKPWISKK